MRNFIRKFGFILCSGFISAFTAAFSDYVCITFFGEPEFPEKK